MLSVAATALVCIGATVAYQWGHLRLTTTSQESYIASVSNHVTRIMRIGLRDHIDCAVFRKYPKTPPTVEEFTAMMGPKYAGLVPVVRERMPTGLQLVFAHRCKYHDRQFVHLAFTGGGRLMSLVFALKGEGESFETENLVPDLKAAGIPVYLGGVQRFQIAAFETRDHLVYLISDSPQQGNTEMMLALVPGVEEFLRKLES